MEQALLRNASQKPSLSTSHERRTFRYGLMLLLLATLFLPWNTRAQGLSSYITSTGVDSTRWIQLSSLPPTSVNEIIGSGVDDGTSEPFNIGFPFTLAGTTYSQFSVSSNGSFRLGDQYVSSYSAAGYFNSSYLSTSLPKIIGVTADLSTYNNGYVKAAVTGTAPHRVFVCEYNMCFPYNNYSNKLKWQIQLHEDSSKVVLIFGSNTPSSVPDSYQSGIAVSTSDFLIFDPSDHTITHHDVAYSTMSSVWHGANRYYQVMAPVATCPKPSNFTLFKTTSNTTVRWTEYGTATQWLYTVSTTTLANPSSASLTSVTTPSATLTGLTPNTTYHIYVAAFCGVDDTSLWSHYSFTTPCEVTPLPYSENFDSYSGTTNEGLSYHILPPCWDWSNDGNSSFLGYPLIYSASSYAQSGENSLRFYTSSTTYYGNQLAVLPPIDSLAFATMSLSARGYSDSYLSTSMLQVGLVNFNGDDSSFVALDTIDGLTTSYQSYIFDLSNAANYPHLSRVALRAPRTATSYSQVHVDNISVIRTPSCALPTDVTATMVGPNSITVSWNNPDEDDNATYKVIYGTTGFDPDGLSATTVTVTGATTKTLTGLTANTGYDIYVRNICSDASVAPAANILTIKTLCNALTASDLPYSYGFEDATADNETGTINGCWKKGTNYPTAYPYPSSSSNTGSHSLYFYGYNNYYSYAAMPMVNVRLDSLLLKFSMRQGSTATYYEGTIQVGYMTNPYDINTFVPLTNVNAGGSTFQQKEVYFLGCQERGVCPAFRCIPVSATYNNCYIDDIELDFAPNCSHVEQLDVRPSVTSAVATWDAGVVGHYSGAHVQYKEHAALTWTNAPAVSASEYSCLLSSLTPNTQYDVRVAQLCGVGDTSEFVTTTFSTIMQACLALDPINSFNDTLSDATPYYNYNSPVGNYHNYSFSEQLVLSSEIGTGNISSIEFEYGSSYPMTQKTNCTIYLGTTSLTEITTSSHVALSDMTAVYQGPLNCSEGWNNFEFNLSNFEYDGTGNLVVAVVDNSGSYNGNTYYFKMHSATGKNIYWVSDGSAFNGYVSSYLSYRNNMVFHFTECAELESCRTPEAFVSYRSADTIGLTWIPGLNETSWLVYHKLHEDSEYTADGVATSNRFFFANLTPASVYDFKVTVDCGGGDSLSAEVTATTQCLRDTLPFHEGFASWSTESTAPVPSCWTFKNTYTSSYTYPYVNSYYSSDGDGRSLYMYNPSGSYSRAWFVLPLLEDSIHHLQLSCDIRNNTNSPTIGVRVGVMSDPEDYNTFVEVANLYPDIVNEWQNKEVSFGNYHGREGQIAFMILPSAGYCYAYLDNIVVERIPSCPKPSYLTTTVTNNTATIGWNGPINADLGWEVEYGPSGFEPGNGTRSIVATNSATLNNLCYGTDYDVYVRALCAADDTSLRRKASFSTPCAIIARECMPYTQGFETSIPYESGTMPNCWTKLSTYNANYPYVSTEQVYSGTKSLYFYTTGSGNHTTAILPEFAMSVDSLVIRFKARMTSSYYNLTVGVMTNPADYSTFVPVDTIVPVAYSTFEDYEVEFLRYVDNTNSEHHYIALSANNNMTDIIYVDDIEVAQVNFCRPPVSVTVDTVTYNQAEVSWVADEFTAATTYEIRWSTIDDANAATNTLTATGTSATITGLEQHTDYYGWVRAVCGGEATNDWLPFTFSTECGYLPIPYVENFETYAGTTGEGVSSHILPICWSYYNTGTVYNQGYPLIYNSTSMAQSGSNSIRFYAYASAEYGTQMAVTPMIDSMAFTTLAFSARTGSSSYTSSSILYVGLVDEEGNYSSFVPLDTINNLTVDYQTYVIDLAEAANHPTLNRLAFLSQPTTSYSWIHLDDLSLTRTPACAMPTDVTLTNIDINSVELEWSDEEGTASTVYRVVYGPQGFDRTSLSAQYVTVIGHTNATISGLTANTQYDIYVTKMCSNFTVALATNMLTVRTLCNAMTGADLPYVYGFEDATNTGSTGRINNCWITGSNQSYNYPNPSNTRRSGVYSLYFYSYNNYYSYAAMPLIDVPLDSLRLTFYMRSQYTGGSYEGTIQVGYMTDPYDISTFVPVTNIVNNETNYQQQEVFFVGYPVQNVSIAFRSIPLSNPNNSCYIDDIELDYAPSCTHINNLNVDATLASATVSWEPGSVGNYQGAHVEYKEHSAAVWTSAPEVSASEFSCLLTSLNPNTAYDVRVAQLCGGNDTSDYTTTSFGTSALECILADTANMFNDTINTGSASTTYNIPVNNYYRYSFSEQLVLSSEISTGNINAIEFQYAIAAAMTYKTNCTIYLGTTSLTSLSTSSFVPLSSLTPVYQGPLNCSEGWNTFEFNLANYNYDGTSNLVVAVVDNSYGYNNQGYQFNTHYSPDKVVYYYDDNVPFSGSVHSTSSYRSNMAFHFIECLEMESCRAPEPWTTYSTADSVGLSWTPGYDETSWSMSHKQHDDSVYTSDGTTTDNSFFFANLLPNTTYDFRITVNCGGGNTLSNVVTLTTPCLRDTLPFYESFATWDAGNTAEMPSSCWTRHTSYNSSYYYPYVYNNYSSDNDGRCLYMYNPNSNNSRTWIALPLLEDSIHNLQLTLDIRNNNYHNNPAYGVRLGVMSDPDDYNTFVEVENLYPTIPNTWQAKEVSFANYNGPEGHIAFMAPPLSSYNYNFLDNILVERIPSCPKPSNIAADITGNTVTLSWEGPANANLGWEVEYGANGFEPGEGTVIPVAINSVSMGGLCYSTDYDVYIRALCAAGDTSLYRKASFTTACAPIARNCMPYTQGFENCTPSTSGTIPNCWTKQSSYNVNYPYVSNNYASSGSQSLYMYSTGENHTAVVLPEFAMAIDSLALNLKVRFSYTNTPMLVGVMTNPNDYNTFVPVDTININGYYAFYNYEVEFLSYVDNTNSDHHYIALSVETTEGYTNYFYIDDIEVSMANFCRPPLSVDVDNITYNQAEVSWVSDSHSNAAEYEVRWSTTDNAEAATNNSVATTSPVTLTGLSMGTTYYAWVRAFCADNETTSWMPTGSFTTVLLTCDDPTTTVSNVDSTTATFSWSSAADQHEYAIKELSAGVWSASTTTSQLSHTFTNLTPGTTYQVRVRALCYPNLGVNSDWVIDQFTTDNLSCYIPSNLAASNIGTQSATLSWTANGTETSWLIHVYNSSYDQYYTSIGQSYAVTGLSYGTTYNATVQALCSTGDTSAISNVCTFTTNYPPCDAPTSLGATSIGTQSTSLSWMIGGIETSWLIHVYNSSYNQWFTTNDQYYTVTGLTPGTTYNATVQALCPSGDTSSVSNIFSFTTDNLPCIEPTNLASSNVGLQTATLSWTAGSTETSWLVHIYNSSYSQWYNANSTTYSLTGLTQGTTYNATVQSLCSSGDTSSISNVCTFTTNNPPCYAPTSLAASNVGMQTATLSWTAGGTETSWLIHVYNSSYNQWYTATSNTYALSGLSTGTTYNATVQALCSTGDTSNISNVCTFTTNNPPCYAPTSLAASNVGLQTATLSWTAGGTETSWLIHVYGDAYSQWFTANSTTYALSNLTPGTTYNATVQALCSTGDTSNISNVCTFTTNNPPCYAPTSLAASNVTTESATLTWTAGGTETSWLLHVYNNSYSQWYTVTNTTYALSNLTPGTTYNATVQSLCSSGDTSSISNVCTFTTNNPPCYAPTNLAASNVTTESATLTWTAGGTETSWLIHVYGDAYSQWFTANSTTYALSNLTPGTTYNATVQALCSTGDTSDISNVCTFTTDNPPCHAPTNLAASNIGGTEATITWTAGGTETEWLIKAWITPGSEYMYQSNSTSYTLTGLMPGTTYNVTVQALCSTGDTSSPSEVYTFTSFICNPVSNVQVSAITGTSATVSWTAGDNNNGHFEVFWYQHGGNIGNPLGNQEVTATSYNITGLIPNTHYDVAVRAICDNGYHSDAVTTDFTTQQVGIASVEEGLNLNIYPNPANGNTTITLGGVSGSVTLSVLDMSGRTVKTTTMECDGDCVQTIDVDHLAAGAYFVRVVGDNVNTVKKLIVR